MFSVKISTDFGSSYSVIHAPNLSEANRVCVNPQFTQEINKHGSCRFTVPRDNALYDAVTPRKTLVSVLDDGVEVWRGRVISITRGMQNSKDVYCEGELAYFTDSYCNPYGFTGSPEQLLSYLIDQHNTWLQTQLPEQKYRAFALGNVTVRDPNDTIRRSWAKAENIWTLINDKLIKPLGGYLYVRVVNGVKYLDYLADTASTSTQTIEFGKNLLDFSKSDSAANVANLVFPYGAYLDPEDPDYMDEPPANGSWSGNRVTIASVNSGSIYLAADGTGDFAGYDGITKWGGVICATKIWDDVTVPANLKTKATRWLKEQLLQSVTIDSNAVDLSMIDVDVDKIEVGQSVPFISKIHDIDAILLCRLKTIYMVDPEKNRVVLGDAKLNMTDLYSQT